MYLTRIQGIEQTIQQNRMSWSEGIPTFYILLKSRGVKSKARPKLVLHSTTGVVGSVLAFVLFHSLCVADSCGRGCCARDSLRSGYCFLYLGVCLLFWSESCSIWMPFSWWGQFISLSLMLGGMRPHLFGELFRIEVLWVSSGWFREIVWNEFFRLPLFFNY